MKLSHLSRSTVAVLQFGLTLALFSSQSATAWGAERIAAQGFSCEVPAGWTASVLDGVRVSLLGDGFPGKFGVVVAMASTADDKAYLEGLLTVVPLDSDAVLSNGRHFKYSVLFGAPSEFSPNGNMTIRCEMDVGPSIYGIWSSSYQLPKLGAKVDPKPFLDVMKEIAASIE